MSLPVVVYASCESCRLRPREEGGSGACPKVGVHRDIFVKRGRDNGCDTFDPREFVPKAVAKAAKLHPQEAGLF